MDILKRLSIAWKLGMSFGIVLLCCLVLAGYSLHQLAKVNEAVDELGNRALSDARLLATMNSRLNLIRRIELRMLVAKDEKDFAAEYGRLEQPKQEFLEAQQKYESQLDSDLSRQDYGTLKAALDAYWPAVERSTQMGRNHSPQQEIDAFSKGQGRQAFNDVSAALDRSIKDNDTEGLELTHQANSNYEHSRLLIFLLTAMMVVLIVLVSMLSVRGFTRPISQVCEALKKVADGDLRERLQIDTEDELGQLAQSLNHTVESLNTLLGTISQSAAQLAAASEEISANAADASQSAQQQTDQTNQVATAMHEMSVTVVEVGNNSQTAAGAARTAADTARTGGSVIDETLTAMHSIAGSSQDVAARIGALSQSSEKIGAIAAVIDDIAAQTNLLALNAAIEAARAGEQGRGFAVVADEVRKLAERTTTATKEIGDMIGEVQNEARAAVEAVQQGTNDVQRGVENTERSGKALAEIIQVADKVGEMITQIATAATEQSAAAETVNVSVASIADMTAHSNASAAETAKACTDLSDLALNMQNMVTRFRLDERHSGGAQPASNSAALPGGRRSSAYLQ